MRSSLVRLTGLLGLLLIASASVASGATQEEVDRAIKGGTSALKARYERAGTSGPVIDGSNNYGIGSTCLAGLALLETGTPVNAPALKTITDFVRNAAYRETKTYQISLCLMFLDRLGDPADEPLIQALAVRLLVGQTSNGGWNYNCLTSVSPEDEKWLRGLKPDKNKKLHPEVEKYGQILTANRNQPGPNGVALPMSVEDNSNTQFALLAVWMARKHAVPVENSLELVEKRFMASQDQRTGNWAYNGAGMNGGRSSPSMYCAGLLGMATSVARREERKLKPSPSATSKPNSTKKNDAKSNDPFYNPPASKDPPKKSGPKRPADGRDLTIQRAFAGLGLALADQIRGGRGLLPTNSVHGHGDLYFLWSMERVGVVYGMDKIGEFDWYDVGSTAIVRSQARDGTWTVSGYGAEVNTALAILFLSRSNLARDLSNKVRKDPTNTEMRAGNGPSANDVLPNGRNTSVANPSVPIISLPNPTGDEAITLASKMLQSSDNDWAQLLKSTRDTKGITHTRALVLTATNTSGTRKKQAREALAERLCRMTATTLRTMLKAEQTELRRAAALACAMKDDKTHVADLIDLLADTDDSVVRAAHAGLKSLTGKDFGPSSSPSAGEKALAISAWKEWFAKQKK